jgi:hypothetical protein
MAIYDPNLVLSDADREALALLASLILGAAGDSMGDNVPPDTAPLSISQAKRLLHLLEQLFSSKKFIEGSLFCGGHRQRRRLEG